MSARKGTPPEIASTALTNLNPTPDRAMDPITSPAEAHAVHTSGTVFEPSCMAWSISLGPILLPGVNREAPQAVAMPATALYIGVYPASSM